MDLWTVKEFLSFDQEDMFSNTILALNPSLENARKLESSEKETYFSKYVEQVYKKEHDVLAEKEDQLQQQWDKVEDNFLTSTRNLFNEQPWPQGSYVGFLSIFNCNPRFLDQKTFQCFYRHQEGLLYVSAHEMLHFMFYSYIENHENLVKDVKESVIWKLSEIFNVVILGLPEFVDITNNPKPKPYPKHKELIPEFTKLWNDKKQVDSFIENAIEKIH
jgi:hypothetical protein